MFRLWRKKSFVKPRSISEYIEALRLAGQGLANKDWYITAAKEQLQTVLGVLSSTEHGVTRQHIHEAFLLLSSAQEAKEIPMMDDPDEKFIRDAAGYGDYYKPKDSSELEQVLRDQNERFEEGVVERG